MEVWRVVRTVYQLVLPLSNVIWDTSWKSCHSSFLPQNASENNSSETSQPLATSSLALSFCNVTPHNLLHSLSYAILKLMRSTCDKSTYAFNTSLKTILHPLYAYIFLVLNIKGSPTPHKSTYMYAPSPPPYTLPKLILSVTVQVTDLVISAGNGL